MATENTSKAKDTVRKGKKSAMISTQRFLPIAEIHHDTVMLKGGGMRALLEVEAQNFNLKSETEQQGIIAGYQSFMNTLDFPIQIVIRSSKMNIDPYIERLRKIAETQHTNELLKKQTLLYAEFVEKLVDVADIMQKRFYVVVPIDQNLRPKSVLEQFFSWMNPDDNASNAASRYHDFASHSRNLSDRVSLVQTGLTNVGLPSKRLATRDLVELYYHIYNPRTSEEQKLPAESEMKVDKGTL